MIEVSKINRSINEKFLMGPETLYYDRKSAMVEPKKLANEVASFANANGGVVAVGITDNGIVEGFNYVGIDKLNELQKCIGLYLKPVPFYQMELVNVINSKQEKDVIILFHIEPSMNFIVRNTKDEVYCRQGDSSIKLTHDQVKSLEYNKRERNFETELVFDSSVEDIDNEVVNIYKEKIDAKDLDNIEVLKARGYLKEYKDKLVFTNAGMLLFGKSPSIYMPWARLRVLKFEGNEFKTGTEMNIIKEKTFDKNIYRILNESREFINSQLREFTYLNSEGVFEKHLEYPEFAWYEGIVNAIAHRDYSNIGEQILVKIFNNRIEILSPGKLGGFVTVDTIRNKRYSRNPLITRTLVEFGMVRELNEGVKRMFLEMEEYGLDKPVYEEPGYSSVLLILHNNIEKKEKENTEESNTSNINNDLTSIEEKVLDYINKNNGATRSEISKFLEKGRTYTTSLLNDMANKDLIVWTGTTKNDRNGKYIIKQN